MAGPYVLESFADLGTLELDRLYPHSSGGSGTRTLGAYGPAGGRGVRLTATVGGMTLGTDLPTRLLSFVEGFRVFRHSAGYTALAAFRDGVAGVTFLRLAVNEDSSVTILTGNYDASTPIWTSAPGRMPILTFHEIQWKGTFHASAGTITLKLNGETLCTLTGQNTMPSPAASATEAYLESNAGAVDYSDWWLFDQSSGGVDNFPGDDRVVESSLVDTGSATYAEWTPSTGTDHGALVDDPTSDEDATYIAAETIGLRDTFSCPALTAVQSVDAALLDLTMRKVGTAPRAVAALSRHGGSDTLETTDHYLATDYTEYRTVLTPLTGVTVATADATEIGAQVTV